MIARGAFNQLHTSCSLRVMPTACLRVALLAAALGVVATGCGSFGTAASSAPTTTVPPTTLPAVTTTTRPPTTTTVAIPEEPEAAGADAAATLVDAWAEDDRQQALAVATPEAVATLFAVAYPNGLANSRGCSDPPVPPVVCSYGPPGGSAPTDPLYEIYVSRTAKGWYVSSVEIDN